MSPARFALACALHRRHVAMLCARWDVHINKRLNRRKPIVFDRTPKKGA